MTDPLRVCFFVFFYDPVYQYESIEQYGKDNGTGNGGFQQSLGGGVVDQCEYQCACIHAEEQDSADCRQNSFGFACF